MYNNFDLDEKEKQNKKFAKKHSIVLIQFDHMQTSSNAFFIKSLINVFLDNCSHENHEQKQ